MIPPFPFLAQKLTLWTHPFTNDYGKTIETLNRSHLYFLPQKKTRVPENRTGHVSGFHAVISVIVTNHDKWPCIDSACSPSPCACPVGSMGEVRLLSARSSPTCNLEPLTSWMEPVLLLLFLLNVRICQSVYVHVCVCVSASLKVC